MSVRRNSRNVNQPLVSQDGEESDLEESQILEERLKNLLSTKKKELNRKGKNIFNDFQGDVPKLRHSVIARALDKVVCSTPMPTDKQRDFFPSQTAFNISPIDPVSEELDYQNNKNPPGCNENFPQRKNKIFDKEAKVILTRTPVPTIIIIDSSSDNSDRDATGEEKIKDAQSETASTEKQIPYNTRRQSKNNTKQEVARQDQDNCKTCDDNTRNNISKVKVSQSVSHKKSLSRKRMDLNSVSTKKHNTTTSENEEKRENTSTCRTRKDTSQTKSFNQSRRETLDLTKNVNALESTKNEKSVTKHSNYAVSQNQSGERRNNNISKSQSREEANTQQNAQSPIKNSKNLATDEIKTTNKSKRENTLNGQDEENHRLKDSQNDLEPDLIKSIINEIYDRKNQSHFKTKTPSRSSNKISAILNSLRCQSSQRHQDPLNGNTEQINLSNVDINLCEENLTLTRKKSFRRDKTEMKTDHNTNSSRNNKARDFKNKDPCTPSKMGDNARKSERRLTEIDDQEIALKKSLSHKKNATKPITDHTRKISPRKLYFPPKDSDTQECELNELMKNEIVNGTGRIRKIPILRNGSKSRQEIIQQNFENSPVRTRSACAKLVSESVGNVTNVGPPSPPKRPPRKKKGRTHSNTSELSIDVKTTLDNNVTEQGKSMRISKLKETFTTNSKLLDEEKIIQASVISEPILNEKNTDKTSNPLVEVINTPRLEQAFMQAKQNTKSSITESISKTNNKKNMLTEVGTCTSPCSFTRSSNVPQIDNVEKHLSRAKSSVGTSPILFEKLQKETSVLTGRQSGSAVETCVNADGAPMEEHFNTRKSISSVNCTIHPKESAVVDAGTSPLDVPGPQIGFGKDTLVDKKIDKLNKLLTKMSHNVCQKFFDSPSTPSIENNYNKLSTQVNHTLPKHNGNSKSSPIKLLEKVSCSMNREVQTSQRRSSRKISPRKNFAKSIFTRTVIEQQTQTTGSIEKTYKRNRNVGRRPMKGYISDSSRNTSTTDQSEVLKELEREENMLFQSLTEGVLPPSFLSSDDEIAYSVNEQNLPWRVDDEVIPGPRRSSFKLNFLRSAHEIELEKRSSMHPFRTYHSSDSDSEVEGGGLEKKRKSREKEQVSVLGYTRKNKLQVYTRSGQEKNSPQVKIPESAEERSSSPNSEINIPSSDPETDHVHVSQDRITPEIPNEVTKHPSDNTVLETTLTRRNLNAHNSIYKINDNLEDKVIILLNRTVNSSPPRHVQVPVGKERSVRKVPTCQKSDDKVVYEREKDSDGMEENADDDEILAVPLEDSDGPDVDQAEVFVNQSNGRKVKSQELQKVDNCEIENTEQQQNQTHVSNKKVHATQSSRKSNDACPAKELEFKIPKTKGRKAKKQIIAENDDGVSSTTMDSNEQSGVRRSGRERKPTRRRVLGVVATSSERVLQYYNGTNESYSSHFIADDVSIKTSKPRTKRQTTTKKTKMENKQSEVKNTKRSRKKNDDHVAQEMPEIIANAERSSIVNRDSVNFESNDGLVNTMQPCSDDTSINNSKMTRKQKRNNSIISSTTDIPVNNETQAEIPKKKNRKVSEKSEKSTSSNKNTKSKRVPHTSDDHISCSTNLNIDNDYIVGEVPANTNEVNVSFHCNINENRLTVDLPCEEVRNTDFMCPSSEPQETTCNNLEHTQSNKPADKDSGRSTMLKSTTFDDSNIKIPKPLTGRIGKRYKKREDNFASKISKVLSRSINRSKELELLNGDNSNTTELGSGMDDKLSRRSSLMQTKLVNGDYINYLCNNEIVSMKYVDQPGNYKVVRDNLMVTDSLKIGGGRAGHLKLLPGCQKPLHIAKKYNLVYFVIEGEGLIQVSNKTSRIGKLSSFGVPLGVEYSINNLSKADPLVLGFVKMPPDRNF